MANRMKAWLRGKAFNMCCAIWGKGLWLMLLLALPAQGAFGESLQRGAELYATHCLSCHGVVSVSYANLTELGLSEVYIRERLMWREGPLTQPMLSSLSAADAERWFGVVPPDLSLIARSRAAGFGETGEAYLRRFLHGFYRDQQRITGWNNVEFEQVAMPHPLWASSGPMTMTEREVVAQPQSGQWLQTITQYDTYGVASVTQQQVVTGDEHKPLCQQQVHYENEAQAMEYQQQVEDLSAFLTWVSAPETAQRHRIGYWVVAFLSLFLVVLLILSRSYWKQVQ